MTMNHLPDDLLPFWLFGSPWLGAGYGLGFAVVMDAAQRPTLASTGTYEWWSRTATLFWVDPQEELIGLFMPQGVAWRLGPIFRNLVYQAIVD
jgi:CubicO group peptidase (beta-lactamase class C family)